MIIQVFELTWERVCSRELDANREKAQRVELLDGTGLLQVIILLFCLLVSV